MPDLRRAWEYAFEPWMSAAWSALSYGRDSLKAVIRGSVAPRNELEGQLI